MNKEEVLESIIKAITLIEDNPQKYLVDYVIYDALCNARDYLMLDS